MSYHLQRQNSQSIAGLSAEGKSIKVPQTSRCAVCIRLSLEYMLLRLKGANILLQLKGTNIFKEQICTHRQNREIIYNFCAQLQGTRSHSRVLSFE